jgi:hypothetical protein
MRFGQFVQVSDGFLFLDLVFEVILAFVELLSFHEDIAVVLNFVELFDAVSIVLKDTGLIFSELSLILLIKLQNGPILQKNLPNTIFTHFFSDNVCNLIHIKRI